MATKDREGIPWRSSPALPRPPASLLRAEGKPDASSRTSLCGARGAGGRAPEAATGGGRRGGGRRRLAAERPAAEAGAGPRSGRRWAPCRAGSTRRTF